MRKKTIISKDVPPPHLDHEYRERGLDPWHTDAFADEFKHAAPNTGERKEGWYELDWCGNVIGFIPDGTIAEELGDGKAVFLTIVSGKK